MKKTKVIERLLCFFFLLFLLACKPVIVSFIPEQGKEGTDVIIKGKNFGKTPNDNKVEFKGIQTTNVAVPEPNKLAVKVPGGAETGLISVKTKWGKGFSAKDFVVPTVTKWTFMVYLDADNNLEQAGLDDFLEMASVNSSKNIKIVVQMDRAAGHSSAYGDWQDTRRFLIHKNDTPAMNPLQNLGEQNMGDPATLQDFVEWAIDNYPAEHYALAIWNHGGGWRMQIEKLMKFSVSEKVRGTTEPGMARAVAWDDTNNDVLYMKEVQQALEGAKARLESRYGMNVMLDIVGFDACLMGMIEVAYALRNVTNYLIGSEQTEPFNGWPYNTILSALVSTPSFTPRDLSGIIVTDYQSSYTGNYGITQAALDISKLSDVASKVDNFTAAATAEWASLKAARSNSIVYNPGYNSYWGVDLWDFTEEVRSRVTSASIQTAAQQLKATIDELVVNEAHSSDMAGSHGLAIYFPATLSIFNNDPDHTGYVESNTFMPVDFVRDHRWDNWLMDYYAHIE